MKPLANCLWSKVVKCGPDECWPWIGKTTLPGGYGRLDLRKSGRGHKLAHRAAWEVANGRELRRDELACHRCDNPSCCNPAHIFVGSASDNVRDMHIKKRHLNSGKTHCLRGHEFTADNTYNSRGGRRHCIQCRRLRQSPAFKKAAALARAEA